MGPCFESLNFKLAKKLCCKRIQIFRCERNIPFNRFTRHLALYCDLFEQEKQIMLETRRKGELFFVFCFIFVFYLSHRRVVGKGNVDGGMRGGNSGNSPPSPAQTVTQINYPVCSPLSSTSRLQIRLNCKSDGRISWKIEKLLVKRFTVCATILPSKNLWSKNIQHFDITNAL